MRRRTVATVVAGLTVGATVLLTEVAVPTVAESRVRDQLAPFASVTSVEISTSPAVMLMFGRVDSAAIRLSSATLDAKTLDPEMLDRASTVEVLDAQVDRLRAGPLDARSVVLKKRGPALEASARLDVDQIESLVPGARLKVEDEKVLLELPELPLPLSMPGPLQLQIDVEEGDVVARPRRRLRPAADATPARPPPAVGHPLAQPHRRWAGRPHRQSHRHGTVIAVPARLEQRHSLRSRFPVVR